MAHSAEMDARLSPSAPARPDGLPATLATLSLSKEVPPDHTETTADKSEAENSDETKSTLYPKISGKILDITHHISRHSEPPEGAAFPFTGTAKLHGTHADILVHGDGSVVCQSRNRPVLTQESDNLGFAAFVSSRKPTVLDLAAKLKARWSELHPGVEPGEEPMILAGEWIGTNIQKGVALSKLPRSFVLCSLMIAGKWEDIKSYAGLEEAEHSLHNISRGGFFHLDLDLTDNGAAFMQKAEILTNEVCAECPYGKAMGAIGKGEGIVWTPSPDSGLPNYSDFWLKTKGEQFLKSSKTPKSKTDQSALQLNHIELCKRFGAEQCTVARMEQAWAYLLEMGIPRDVKGTGRYLAWLWNDIEVEEKREIEELGIGKGWRSEMAKIAKGWYEEK